MSSRAATGAGDNQRDGVVRGVLKDGYWDRTELIEMPDGSRRVRKRTKGAAAPGPWGVESLRREIRYLANLPRRARALFPEVLVSWDVEAGGVADVGYDMPFYAHHVDAARLAQQQALAQDEIDLFQDTLAAALLERLHEPMTIDEPLSAHIGATVPHALSVLEHDEALARLVCADSINLNGRRVHGPRAAFARIGCETNALMDLDAGPRVRLHGDFFLENILWRPATAPDDGTPRLIMLDPVSVAGVSAGTPLFDLVKYESYATGELLALRSEWIEVEGPSGESAGGEDPSAPVHFEYHILWDHPGLLPFRTRDWHTRFRRAFEVKYGRIDPRACRLLDGYFSVAMAVNTHGLQRRARLLKATADFNAVLDAS